MAEMRKKPTTKQLEAEVEQLTADLQRTRADFENYRKRVEAEKESARQVGKSQAILKLLPVIDNIERAIGHLPAELKANKWAQGVVNLTKSLDKSLESLELKRIDAKPGTVFDPNLHEAIQMDEDSDGDQEIVAEELQAGYLLSGQPIRHAMVRVKRQ